MKKFIIYSLLAIATLLTSSCKYDDYYGDYTYSTTYFAYDQIDRSVILDEYDYIQVGVVLGGKISNDVDEWVQYELVDDMVTDAGYEVLPSSYYTTENNTYGGVDNVITIEQGNMLGMMKITLLPEFYTDARALMGAYALGFRILDASTDSIGKDETLITFKYLSNAIGFYTHSGVAISDVDTLVYTNPDVELTTVDPVGTNSVRSDKVTLGSNDLVFDLTVDEDDNVDLSTGTGSALEIDAISASFDRDGDHTICLEYTFSDAGVEYHANDTLVFVQRIVDGITQWDTTYF